MQEYTPKDFASELLAQHGVEISQLEQIIAKGHPRGANFSELYLQKSRSSYFGYEESQLKAINNSAVMGCGARIVCGDLAGLAYCDTFDLGDISQALSMAAGIAKHAQNPAVPFKVTGSNSESMYKPVPTPAVNPLELTQLFGKLDAKARAMPMVERVELSLAYNDEVLLVLNTLDVCNADLRPLWRAQVRLVLNKNGRRESGSCGSGGRQSVNLELASQHFEYSLDKAWEEASINLESKPCKAGAQTVVLGSGWPGVLLHEAVGHGLEGDFNRKQTSVYSGKIGEQVAAVGCTIVDNGRMPQRRGSLSMDDEGMPSQENVLIENGILCGYMQDMQNAMLMGQAPTGNGRRESYAHTPMPRMTNTYMLAGKHSRDEIISSVDDGIYAVNFSGGQVDITSGNFVFNSSLAYRIEKGRITHPVKGVSLIGNGPQVMQQVTMVGDDLKLDPGVGVCGKDGQSVPVGVGQPTLKVSSIVVGGQS